MIALFDTFRRTTASRPLWLFLALFLASVLIRRLAPQKPDSQRLPPFARALTISALVYYIGVVIWYACVPQQADDAEPTILGVAWLFSIGKPLYHSLDSAERYAHMYGPMSFIVPGAVFALVGPGMMAGKAVGATAALVALGATWSAVRRAASGWPALVACGICVLQFLMFRNMTFWSRPEPLQLAAVATGLYAAARWRGQAAVMVIGLSVGLLCNLKITGPLYSLPILALCYARLGMRPTVWASAAAVITAALPFLVFPNVSWENYWLWVGLSAQNGLRLALLKENIEWAIFLLLPVLIRLSSPEPLPRSIQLVTAALLVAVAGAVIAASKPGAGTYHLVPFLPILALLFVAPSPHPMLTSRRALLAPYLLTMAFVVIVQQEYFLRLTTDAIVADSFRDVEEYLTRHPDERVAMGYTSAERMTFSRIPIVFRTGAYLLDVPAIQEHQLSGVALPAATVEAMRSCTETTWLLPRAGQPFHILNAYPSTGHSEIFPPALIAAFQASYSLEEHTRHYDVWRCRTRP